MQGYGWAEGEERKRRRHMLPVSTLGMNTVASDSTTSSTSVCQDGRKITVGDSALFKPLQWQDSPPFIHMIIRDHPNACFEQQEEVDQLLDKTRLEMHAAVESGGHSSSKPLNGPTQTSTTPTPTSTPPIMNMLESEIAKITDKGGLVDFDGVEKFVQLMQPDRTEKKIDMAGRIMLADVIASTNSFDCLSHFVQHSGLSVLDEWLQEVHKGKIGDGGSPKEGAKSIKEFHFALLRALDKLPVNLSALQACNVWQSVADLRIHKNLVIRRTAWSLVNRWTRGVEEERGIIAATSRPPMLVFGLVFHMFLMEEAEAQQDRLGLALLFQEVCRIVIKRVAAIKEILLSFINWPFLGSLLLVF